MDNYSQKMVHNLRPKWYLDLSKKEKRALQLELKSEREEAWKDKPKSIKGRSAECVRATKTTTVGGIYRVRGHFCTLISTEYGSEWHQHITIKNDYNWIIKVNLKKFKYLVK